MAASSEEALRKIPSRERLAARMPIVFRDVRLPCASKDCLGLLSQEEASIAFCPASTHCDGSESTIPKNIRALRTDRPARLAQKVSFTGSVRPARIVAVRKPSTGQNSRTHAAMSVIRDHPPLGRPAFTDALMIGP